MNTGTEFYIDPSIMRRKLLRRKRIIYSRTMIEKSEWIV